MTMPYSHNTSASRPRWVLRAGLALVVAGVLLLTLIPMPPGAAGPELVLEYRLGARFGADALANVLLFIPVGVAAALNTSAARTIGFGAFLSVFIEVAQLLVPGRYTSPADVVFNTIGTVTGMLLLRHARAWLRPPPRIAAVLAGASTIAAAAVIGGGSLLFQASVPRMPLYGQWTAQFETMAVYEGKILSSTVGGEPLFPRRARDPVRLREILLAGDTVTVRFVAGPLTAAAAPIFSIADQRAREVLMIAADNHDLLIRYRMRAADVRLDQPEFLLRDVLVGIDSGDEIALRTWRTDAGLCAEVSATVYCQRGPAAADTWALLLFPLPRPLPALMATIWVAALILPAGFWAPSPRHVMACALTLAIVLALSSHFAPVRAATVAHYAAVLCGAGAGWGVGGAVRRRLDACCIPRG
jgi:VanZ family protein